MQIPSRFLLTALLLLASVPVSAESLRIAVASNFAHTMRLLTAQYEADSGNTVSVSLGSTGKHYAQIVHGAPFDLFLAADSERPQRLVQNGIAIADSRFTYAVGRLVLWTPKKRGFDLPHGLTTDAITRVSIANPRLAPYGRAAREALQALKLWLPVQSKLVRGENAGQAFQFVASGNADAGLVALAQISTLPVEPSGTLWPVPAALHNPIEQQAVLLRDTEAARAFTGFLQSEPAKAIIASAGYETP